MEEARTPDDIATLLRRAGVTLPAEQLAEIAHASSYIDRMIARVRAAEVDDTPAQCFVPLEPGP